MRLTCLSTGLLALLAVSAGAQQLRFDDVVRNLRNPDPKARLGAIRLLREAKYPEAIPAMAPLVLDPVDDIQLEAIAAELSFFLDQDVKTRRMVGLVVEKRNPAVAATSFDLGPTAVLPRTAPPELVSSLLQAVDDENAKVRLDAIYAVGIVAKAPLSAEQSQRLIKALDHYDPSVRDGAARVIGRLRIADAGDALIKAINDSQAPVRYSAMRALGAIHESRAVTALTEQLAFYKKGEGAWSALDALAQIAAPTSVPVFKERLLDRDPYIRRAATEGLGRANDAASRDAIEKVRDGRRFSDGAGGGRLRPPEDGRQLRGPDHGSDGHTEDCSPGRGLSDRARSAGRARFHSASPGVRPGRPRGHCRRPRVHRRRLDDSRAGGRRQGPERHGGRGRCEAGDRAHPVAALSGCVAPS